MPDMPSTHQTPSDDSTRADLAPLDSSDRSGRELSGDSLDPLQQASLRAKEAFEQAQERARAGDESEAIDQYLRSAAAGEAAHEWYLVALSCERVGEFLLNPRPPTDFERALRMFRRAAAAYERCGMSTEARELSYRISLFRLWRVRDVPLPWLHRCELFLYWLTAGFGLRPMRVVATAITVILLYGVVYWLIDGAIDLHTEKPVGILESIYFSGITFTTIGYGDLIPAVHARFVALTEGFLGAFLMGFFVVVLAHRLTRL